MFGIPPAPLVLGLAGLIPFWGLALLLAAHAPFGFRAPEIEFGLATYGAVILSFLGGIRWGLAAAGARSETFHYALSVVPSLVGWALLAAPEPWRLIGLGLAVLVSGPIDARLVKEGLAPPWLGRLRLILSCGAGVALFVGAFHSTALG